jgi:hypothetical protein
MNPRIKVIPLAKTQVTEANAAKQPYGDERYVLHHILQPDLRGQLACQFAERWALVAAETDGEDSAGRQKLRRLEPHELAVHACQCVSALFHEFESRDWLLKVPAYQEVIALFADPGDQGEVEAAKQSQSQKHA